jgi:GntR family transcriptional regulator, regulator for abcA and norABC
LKREYNEAQLHEDAIKRGVILVPGLTIGEKKGFVRFTFARENEKNIERGIKRFSEAFISL